MTKVIVKHADPEAKNGITVEVDSGENMFVTSLSPGEGRDFDLGEGDELSVRANSEDGVQESADDGEPSGPETQTGEGDGPTDEQLEAAKKVGDAAIQVATEGGATDENALEAGKNAYVAFINDWGFEVGEEALDAIFGDGTDGPGKEATKEAAA